jgi:hypothetical protein
MSSQPQTESSARLQELDEEVTLMPAHRPAKGGARRPNAKATPKRPNGKSKK